MRLGASLSHGAEPDQPPKQFRRCLPNTKGRKCIRERHGFAFASLRLAHLPFCGTALRAVTLHEIGWGHQAVARACANQEDNKTDVGKVPTSRPRRTLEVMVYGAIDVTMDNPI
jgi:hypothetical protein